MKSDYSLRLEAHGTHVAAELSFKDGLLGSDSFDREKDAREWANAVIENHKVDLKAAAKPRTKTVSL